MDIKHIDIGAAKWRGRWISKQDLVEYIRCPYRVFLSYSTGIPITEMKGNLLLQLLFEKGIEFEAEIVRDFKPLEVLNKAELEPLAEQSVLIQVPKVFRNHELGIKGIPDLVNTDKGKFIPFEVKDHKVVTYTDELELAFYWLLLDPLRRKNVKPRGYVVLNTGEVVEVKLTVVHFFAVEEYLNDLRQLMKIGAEPTLSYECKQCNESDKCYQKVAQSGRLSIIYKVSYARENQFKGIGINSITELAKVDERKVNSQFISQFGNTPGVDEIFRMKCHAVSIAKGRPFFFGSEQIFSNIASAPLFVLDLEYDPGLFVWLAGVAILNDRHRDFHQFFAEKRNAREEKILLEALIELRRQHNNSFLTTYSGTSADLPQLKGAWQRNRLPQAEFNKFISKHIDIYQILQSSFRFPMKSMGLSDLEGYLEIKRNSGISSGLQALIEYSRYLRTRKKSIKKQLLDYNKEDLTSTVFIVDKLSELMHTSITIEDSISL